MVVIFSRTPFLNILRCKDHRCDLPEIWKLRFHQTHIPELANMYESSSSHFASTAEIQSGPDAFDKSRFVITFFNQMVVIEALCSFRLLLGRKTGKEKPESSILEFLKKFLANSFALSKKTSSQLNRGGVANLPLLRTQLAICQKPFFLISVCKFGSLKNPFIAKDYYLHLLFCLNITLDLFCWYKRKK